MWFFTVFEGIYIDIGGIGLDLPGFENLEGLYTNVRLTNQYYK